MAEKNEILVRDKFVDIIGIFADRYGIDTNEATERFIAIGGYIIDSVEDGKVFLIESGEEVHYVEWNLPDPNNPNRPTSPPTLRLVK